MNLSTAEQAWLHGQYEPEEKLFVGRKPPRYPKSWMLKPEAREVKDEKTIEQMEDEYLRKHGIV